MAEKPNRAADVVPLKNSKCPNCGKLAAAEYRPFCSERCANIDLGRWFNGDYRIPTNEVPGDSPGDVPDDIPGDILGEDEG